MVLTNFECWAHGGAVVGNDGLPLNTRNVDLFNPRVVQQSLEAATGVSSISHISSNGYYGFSYVNAAHQPANSSHNSAVNTHNICNMPNNNNRNVPNANDVNGMPTMHNGMEIEGAVGGTATALSKGCDAIQRCKKRFFVSDDDYANCALLNSCESGVGVHDVAVAGLNVRAAKRCRFDDDFTAAQYCNDFFSLPSTQIGTQSCLMDTDDTQQHERQQPQVDVTMGAENFTNQATNTSNIHFITQQQQQQHHAQQQQQKVINDQHCQQQSEAQAAPVVAYQQQHNYQGHMHRANRDVSRCLLSHMI